MLAKVIYVKNNEMSEKCKNELVDSLKRYNWDYEVVSGVTPRTLKNREFPWSDLPNGRLESFRENIDPKEKRKYKIKKSCLFNNLRFAYEVVKSNETMIFLEHDVKITDSMPSSTDVKHFCFLNIDNAFKSPSTLARPRFSKWYDDHTHKLGCQEFPSDYPLKYYKNSRYYGMNMTPGTSAYMLTPEGGEKILRAAEEHGLEQSDFIYNSENLCLQYMYPSPLKFQNINPNLSHTL